MKTKNILTIALVGVLAYTAAVAQAASASSATSGKRPNIVIILGDDLGYSDLGCFGGEIKTPNLDSLARAGVRCTQFYTSASCSATRSMLLSGTDTHLNGLGNMNEMTAPNQRGVDGYEGYLNNRVATLPQLLEGLRLPHLYGRQMAHGEAARPNPRRARTQIEGVHANPDWRRFAFQLDLDPRGLRRRVEFEAPYLTEALDPLVEVGHGRNFSRSLFQRAQRIIERA